MTLSSFILCKWWLLNKIDEKNQNRPPDKEKQSLKTNGNFPSESIKMIIIDYNSLEQRKSYTYLDLVLKHDCRLLMLQSH